MFRPRGKLVFGPLGQLVSGPLGELVFGPLGQLVSGPFGELVFGLLGELVFGLLGELVFGHRGELVFGPRGKLVFGLGGRGGLGGLRSMRGTTAFTAAPPLYKNSGGAFSESTVTLENAPAQSGSLSAASPMLAAALRSAFMRDFAPLAQVMNSGPPSAAMCALGARRSRSGLRPAYASSAKSMIESSGEAGPEAALSRAAAASRRIQGVPMNFSADSSMTLAP